MLKQAKQEKLKDYLSGLSDLGNSSSVSIGVIAADGLEIDEISASIRNENIEIIDIGKIHPDLVLERSL